MPATPRRRLGNRGECMAADYLRERRYRIVAMQQRTPHGEIDLVCKDNGTWVFVEVKTRRTETFGPPESAITPEKFSHMQRAAVAYMQANRLENDRWRLDVIAIRLRPSNHPEITHFKAVDTPYQH